MFRNMFRVNPATAGNSNTFVQLPNSRGPGTVFRSNQAAGSIVSMKCLNPRCGAEFVADTAGRYAVELVYTGIDRAFVCPVCQHWNRLGGADTAADAVVAPRVAFPTTASRLDPRSDA
jgi:hypothetical protein